MEILNSKIQQLEGNIMGPREWGNLRTRNALTNLVCWNSCEFCILCIHIVLYIYCIHMLLLIFCDIVRFQSFAETGQGPSWQKRVFVVVHLKPQCLCINFHGFVPMKPYYKHKAKILVTTYTRHLDTCLSHLFQPGNHLQHGPQVCKDRCTSILLGVCPARPDLSSGPPGGRGYFVSLAEIPAAWQFETFSSKGVSSEKPHRPTWAPTTFEQLRYLGKSPRNLRALDVR